MSPIIARAATTLDSPGDNLSNNLRDSAPNLLKSIPYPHSVAILKSVSTKVTSFVGSRSTKVNIRLDSLTKLSLLAPLDGGPSHSGRCLALAPLDRRTFHRPIRQGHGYVQRRTEIVRAHGTSQLLDLQPVGFGRLIFTRQSAFARPRPHA